MKFYDCATAPSPRRVRIGWRKTTFVITNRSQHLLGHASIWWDNRSQCHVAPAKRAFNPELR
jgi:hypothetical protein